VSRGKPRTIRVRPDRHRTTSHADDGRYAAGTARATVGRGGRVLKAFSTTVSAFCIGATLEDNRIAILVAPIGRARIAPDGSVTGRLETESKGTEVQLTGRLRDGHFRGEASIYLRAGGCAGTEELDLKQR
jgi:hypothetical protein